MQLKISEQTQSFSRPWMGSERVHVGSDGVIEVSDSVGEWLLSDSGIVVDKIESEVDTE